MNNRAGGWEKLVGQVKFELKYCERCGGLWLRPAGGEQIYCTGCGREMAKFPAVSREARTSTPGGSGRMDDEFEIDEECGDICTMGGVA
jgi:Zn-finger nucleic acid-binding protein